MSSPRHPRQPPAWWIGAAALSSAAVVALGSSLVTARQQPTFRSSVDLIAVEVQVIDDQGFPIEPLASDNFEVSINGNRRQVVSADYVRSAKRDGSALDSTRPNPPMGTPVASNRWPTRVMTEPPAADGPPGRIYILAFDVGSLTTSDSRTAVASALAFMDRLQPTDRVGLYTFPVGSRIEPTTEHLQVRRLVSNVVGAPTHPQTQFNLTASEIVDINAEASRASSVGVGRGSSAPINVSDDGDTLRKVQIRECGGADARCAESIEAEARSLAFFLEGRATEGLNGLRALITLLRTYQGRKTVVMFSSGIASSDRPGGRPDLGDLAKVLGQDAAATNTTIYTVHIDSTQFRMMSAETGKGDQSPGTRSRDNALLGRALEEFSGASGGALMRVIVGSGEYALDRVLRETSSHYLLSVQPEESDRDGRVKQLRVKVNHPDATVRSRQWVVIPKRPAGGA
jgi:VWFA-related protein